MTNKLKIDISKKEQVTGTTAGRVTGVTWSAGDGRARSDEIALARQKAHEEHIEYLKSLTPEEQRLKAIETRLEAIEDALKL